MSDDREPSPRHEAAETTAAIKALRARAIAHARRYERAPAYAPARFALPQQFDEAGFPVSPAVPSFAERVRHLLAG
jgi:hypothetical protein